MSASAATLHCPVCFGDGVFNDPKSLKLRLIQVLNVNITCPICQEDQLGVSKLITHLSNHLNVYDTSHLNILPSSNNIVEKFHMKTSQDNLLVEKQNRTIVTKNRCEASGNANVPVKYVKIYPKLPVVSNNATPEIDINCQGSDVDRNDPKHNTMCVICGLRFIDSVVLKMHLSLIHNIEDNTVKQCSRHYCHLCPKNFKMRGSLMVHLRVAHFGFSSKKIVSEQNDQNATCTQPNNTPILIKSENKQWQCDVCEKYFTTKYFLKKHKRLHTGETPYACAQCNKTFTFQQSYHKHLLYHNDEKPHTCHICGRAFKELSTLHNHQRIHTGEKPFSCEICGKSFRQRVSYLVHKRIHTGVMPYKCTACNKSFRYKVSQRTHKCTSQPPGVVIRQSVNLLDKLKNNCILNNNLSETSNVNSNILPNIQETIHIETNLNQHHEVLNDNDCGPSYEISKSNADLARSGAMLSLEDTEIESFNLLAHVMNDDIAQNLYDNAPSPSEKLEKLCLTQSFSDT